MVKKTPPKPTVPTAIKSAENLQPGEGGMSITLLYTIIYAPLPCLWAIFWQGRKLTEQWNMLLSPRGAL